MVYTAVNIYEPYGREAGHSMVYPVDHISRALHHQFACTSINVSTSKNQPIALAQIQNRSPWQAVQHRFRESYSQINLDMS
jgi:hypothetical protein